MIIEKKVENIGRKFMTKYQLQKVLRYIKGRKKNNFFLRPNQNFDQICATFQYLPFYSLPTIQRPQNMEKANRLTHLFFYNQSTCLYLIVFRTGMYYQNLFMNGYLQYESFQT
jgi:hypothetical protein